MGEREKHGEVTEGKKERKNREVSELITQHNTQFIMVTNYYNN